MSTDHPPGDLPDAAHAVQSDVGPDAATTAPDLGTAPEPAKFAYGPGRSIELGSSGFRAPRWRGRGEAFIAYRDVTHIALEPRALAVGTAHDGVLLFSRTRLGGMRAMEALAEALRDRVFALPNGAALRARFARLDAKLLVKRPWVAALLVALTGVVYALQQLVPGFYDAAIYRPALLALGEWWRYVATQFLHANLGHLLVNAAASLIAGAFVERSLGRTATLFVAGCAGAGAMLASGLGSYAELLGFSGVAAGFFGALVAVEFFAPAEAPAPARIPRALLVGVLMLQACVDLAPSPPLPGWAAHSAGFAHLGGFAAGGAAALLVRERLSGLIGAGALGTLLAIGASFGIVARNVARPAQSLERQAREMLSHGILDPGELNNLAWQIATSEEPSEASLAEAEKLAELAVRLTGAQEPTVLDTLAEVYFAQGEAERAVEVIDEAIALAPGEAYYEEQRRRFTGERDADDRPEPPEPEPGEAVPDRPERRSTPPGGIDLPAGDEITV